MPKLTEDGHRIIILHFHDQKDSKEILPDVEDFLKVIQLIFDLNLKTDKVKGVTMIYDLDNIGISFLRILIPALKKVVTLQTVSRKKHRVINERM